MAPTGPRNSGHRGGPTPKGGKNTTRGSGISKRKSENVKIDRDGDLDMDAAAASRRAARSNAPTRSRNPTSSAKPSNASRHSKPSANAQKVVQKIITSGSGASLSSRLASGMAPSARPSRANRQVNGANTTTLKVEGLKQSRAAANDGGGLKELLTFLERKAQTVGKTTRNIRIKKVCYRFRSEDLGGYQATHSPHSLSCR
jgi:nuclear RNA export factor